MRYDISTTIFPTAQHRKLGDIKVVCLPFLLLIALAIQGCDDQYSDNDQQTVDQDNAMHNPMTQDAINVVSPDWGNAATLTAMGYPPIATGDIRVWDEWVGEPELPSTVIDLGIRYQPNAELVAQLPVDMVIDNFFYEHARNLYGDVPTESVLFSSAGSSISTWDDYAKPTQRLGDLIGQPKAAETYIANSQVQIEQAGQQLHERYPNVEKFAVVQFIDANNLRMYSNNSLFNTALSMMGYELVAISDGNQWGFTPIHLGDLARLDDDVCLLVVEPLSSLNESQLQRSLIWQRLGYDSLFSSSSTDDPAANHCIAKLEPIWIYGGMSSLVSLADGLASTTLIGGVAE